MKPATVSAIYVYTHPHDLIINITHRHTQTQLTNDKVEKLETQVETYKLCVIT